MSEAFRWIRTFAVVRQTWAALVMLGVALAVGLAFSTQVLTAFGPIVLAVPLPVLLVVPAIAGVGAGMATVEDLRVPLPDPPRAVLARVAWALAFTLLGVGAALAGMAVSDAASPAAITRNVVFHAGLAFLLARTDGRVIWLPGVVLTLMAMLFGQGSGGREVATWAFTLDSEVRAAHLVIAVLVFLVGILTVAWPRLEGLPRAGAPSQ